MINFHNFFENSFNYFIFEVINNRYNLWDFTTSFSRLFFPMIIGFPKSFHPDMCMFQVDKNATLLWESPFCLYWMSGIQVFLEHGLCSRQGSRYWGHSNGQNICSTCSQRACILVRGHVIHCPINNMSGGTDVMKQNKGRLGWVQGEREVLFVGRLWNPLWR